MPPRRFSRHTFTAAVLDEQERLFLTDRERFGFQALADNRQHVVAEGETLFNLAGRFFAPLDRPAGLWWIIADFQPTPIIDPTLELEPGTVLSIPSVQTVISEIFNEDRANEVST